MHDDNHLYFSLLISSTKVVNIVQYNFGGIKTLRISIFDDTPTNLSSGDKKDYYIFVVSVVAARILMLLFIAHNSKSQCDDSATFRVFTFFETIFLHNNGETCNCQRPSL